MQRCIGTTGGLNFLSVAGELQELVEKLAKGLAHPNIAKATEALEHAEKDLQSALERTNEDRSLELAHQVQNSNEDEKFVFRLALRESGGKDPRYVHAGRLAKLMDLITDCKAQLAQKSGDKEKRELLDAYMKALKKEKESRKEDSAGPKPLVLGGLAALASAIMSPVLSSVVKFAAAQMGLAQLVQ